MKFIKTVWLLVFLFISEGCRDVVFNNPLDPDASREDLQILRSFSTSVSGEGDITHDGEKIWKADSSGIITAFDTLSGQTLRRLPLDSCSGIAFYNQLLYLAAPDQNSLRNYDPLSGLLIQTRSTGKYYFSRVAAAENGLIAYDSRTSNIVLYDPEDGSVNSLFQISGFRPGGLGFYDGSVVVSETGSNSVYFFTLTGEVLEVYSSPVQSVSGICVDPATLLIYLITINGNVYQVTVP